MNKPDRISTFGDMKTDLEARTREEFKKEFGDLFAQVPHGGFVITDFPPVEYITITRPPADEHGKVHNLNIRTFWKGDKVETGENFSLFTNGILSAHSKKKMPYDPEKLQQKIVDTLRMLDPRFFYNARGDILPPGEVGPTTTPVAGGRESVKRSAPQPIDPRRLQFMRQQIDVLFAFTGENTGFSGYYGFCFPWGIVLENPRVKNAVYFIEFDTPLAVPQNVFKSASATRFSQEEREQYLAKYWTQFANLSKKEARNAGAKAKYHPHIASADDQWMRDMAAELERRRKHYAT